MAGKRQPTALVKAKGKKHLTKAEIALREAQELHPLADKVAPPDWLTTKQVRRFRELATELINLEILTNLDCEALGRLVKAEDDYVEVTKALAAQPLIIEDWVPEREETGREKVDEDGQTIYRKVLIANPERDKLQKWQDRLWRQTRQGATDFGLTIAGRCRLVAPVKKEEETKNKFLKYKKDKDDET